MRTSNEGTWSLLMYSWSKREHVDMWALMVDAFKVLRWCCHRATLWILDHTVVPLDVPHFDRLLL